MAPLRALLEDPAVREDGAEREVRSARAAPRRLTLRGLVFDTMLASYVLDPGTTLARLDLLALEFLDHTMTSYEDLCGKGRAQIPYDVGADRLRAGLLVRGRRHDAAARAAIRAAARDAADLRRCLARSRCHSSSVLAEMEWAGVAIDVAWFESLKERFRASASASSRRSTWRRERSSTSTPIRSCARSCSRSSGFRS